MQKMKVINNETDQFNIFKENAFFKLLIKFIVDLKYVLCVFFLLFFISIPSFDSLYGKTFIDLTCFIKYVTDCKNLIMYDRDKINTKYPYFSVCISANNMKDYIEKNLLSIINQSFQDFEIIVVNDASEDETENIINRVQSNDNRIKLLSHTKKLGVYRSRIETIFNSKSEYILLMDPDDMYLNQNLFKELYDYNKKKNIDIIEFLSLQQIDGSNQIYCPKSQYGHHFHNFGKDIIYQPELSNILYYLPGTKEYSRTICRNIWNKMIRREIFIQTSNYIGKEYYNEYIITADDMLMNIVTYQFAKNYSNIDLWGYLYVRRNISMSRGGGEELEKIRAINFLFYFNLFYKYLKDYKKDINILFYEMKNLERKILTIKNNNMTQYLPIQQKLIKQILKEKNISKEFEIYLKNLLI
jgi:glycosyltransferase involved in cell wall biosynthesis